MIQDMRPMLLLRNARIWTGDEAQPWAEAALIVDGRYTFVGRERDVSAPAGAETFEAGGRLVVPGFTDAHVHLLATGMAMRSVDLKDATSAEEAARRVGERAARTPHGAWVQGAGWDQHRWPGGAFPHRRLLDAVAPKHPVALTHTSVHAIWANSAPLAAAGVTRETEAPFGGAIERDADGEPTGVLLDEAMRLVQQAIPSPTHEERVATLREAIAHAHSLGVTGVHAMNVGHGELRGMESLRDAGELRLRVRAYVSAERLDTWTEEGVRTGDGDGMLRIGGVKLFADGALGPLTAWMLEPYERSDDRGMPLLSPEELERRTRVALAHGLAPAVHAIGDRANRVVLDVFERTRDVSPELVRRIEHAQLLHSDDVPRFAAGGVVASMQPIHATQDMEKVDRTWGERGIGAYAFASLLRAGATLAFGSDTPVETMDPLAGVHAAVTRRDAAGEPAGGWQPQERITLNAALRAYTSGSAAAAGDAGGGRIAAGGDGDFVVLSANLFGLADPMRIIDARVEATVVGGEVVHARD